MVSLADDIHDHYHHLYTERQTDRQTNSQTYTDRLIYTQILFGWGPDSRNILNRGVRNPLKILVFGFLKSQQTSNFKNQKTWFSWFGFYA